MSTAGRDEAGFTLIELAVALSILALVMGALTGVFLTLLRLAPVTGSTYSQSRDAQLAASYWAGDVRAANGVSTSDRSCTDPHTGKTSPLLVRFESTSADGQVTKLASYQLRPGPSASQFDLIRTLSVASDSRVAPTSTVIAHDVPCPALSCTPACDATMETSSLTVTEASGYSFTVAGTRRVAP